jgi:DNA-binding response OmpR family regulator
VKPKAKSGTASGGKRVKNGVDGAAQAARQAASKKPQLFAEPCDVRVLVVDDETEVLNLLVPFHRKQGYTVSEAQDGDQALEKILTERPNIVVLDVMMPGLSGWEISRYVRERSELDPVRIIMATGIGKDTNAATSPLYGADAYIDKPFRLDALHRTVKDVIARIEAGHF